jgi:hypothetical protein
MPRTIDQEVLGGAGFLGDPFARVLNPEPANANHGTRLTGSLVVESARLPLPGGPPRRLDRAPEPSMRARTSAIAGNVHGYHGSQSCSR